DGRARSEWLKEVYGEEIVRAFKELKYSVDPKGLLNPGIKINPKPMEMDLRYGPEYQAWAWDAVLDFSGQEGLLGAIEMCNGAGVCRKDGGVMCPSFQATRDEMHSTRGRANLLRAMVSGKFSSANLGEQAVMQALDLCLECKGCQAECPSGVDMAKLKYETLHRYYQDHRRPLRDYMFGHIGTLAKMARPVSAISNGLAGLKISGSLIEKTLGISSKRTLPKIIKGKFNNPVRQPTEKVEEIIYLEDPFTRYFYPELTQAAFQILGSIGCGVNMLIDDGAGRTLISKGFLTEAKVHAAGVIESINQIDPSGKMPIIGIEPSDIYTLRDEYLRFFPNNRKVDGIAKRTFLLDEFLIRPGLNGKKRTSTITGISSAKNVLLHGHCYQKSQPPAEDGGPVGMGATKELLVELGFNVEEIEAGCCGMAGSFGYEADHYELSMQVGELGVFPAVRKAGDDQIITAPGVSCRAQIESGTERSALHPLELIVKYCLKDS
ncbi:MAG: 4Fe-4S dicluster domain-containing protein, partial [Anaerolineae bacterium]|nr:4Fe-4S dicluster domain-containing protein [Anaerolineae bacterium]